MQRHLDPGLLLGILLAGVMWATAVEAEKYATTTDSLTVVLYDDGTWEMTDESALEEAERIERIRTWTGIAKNVAKILGVLAVLVTIRFIIQAVKRIRADPEEGD